MKRKYAIIMDLVFLSANLFCFFDHWMFDNGLINSIRFYDLSIIIYYIFRGLTILR